MCIQVRFFSFKLVEYFRCYDLFIASLIKADILRRHHCNWLAIKSNVYMELPLEVSSFYRVISALRFYWSTFVCDTITAVNWPLIESFRFYDENDYTSTRFSQYYRKIHYLTREFHVKLHPKTDIGFQVQFNVEFTSQVMDFP